MVLKEKENVHFSIKKDYKLKVTTCYEFYKASGHVNLDTQVSRDGTQMGYNLGTLGAASIGSDTTAALSHVDRVGSGPPQL